MKRAFTLIELLVVVLIIGILSAIALPQYEKAVVKSRVGAMLPFMATLQAAQEIYYLNNGTYTNDVSALDVDVPAACTPLEDNTGEFSCGQYFLLGVYETGQVSLNYCPGHNASFADCKEVRTVHIAFRPQNIGSNFSAAERGQRECKVYHDSAVAKGVCASLGLKT